MKDKQGNNLWYLTFLVYFYLYLSAFFAMLMALVFFSGGFMDIDLTIPRMNRINIIMAVFHIFKAVLYIVIAQKMRAFRRNSDRMLIWIKIANVLMGTVYVLIRFFMLADTDIYDVIAVLLVTGVPLLINHAYFSRREELFTE